MNDSVPTAGLDRNSIHATSASVHPDSDDSERAALWRNHLLVFGALLAAILFLFGDTYWSMVTTWWRSETFAHGFIVVPISVYLAIRKRATLRKMAPGADRRALPLLALLGLIWLFGDAADVLGVTQLAVTVMIPSLVLLVFGWSVTQVLTFPLAFLLLAVPIGEFLVPPLIDFTAAFTVHALQLTGIPVYWEGNRFSLPSGEWSVVKACSGVRYLYATLTVALLYVYLNYRTRWRQIAFVVIAIVLSIVANGLRAYGIVMIGHLSQMRLAVGIDHFIYGWIFFALLMILLFWIGGFLRERNPDSTAEDREAGISGTGVAGGSTAKALTSALAGLVVLGVFPTWANYVESKPPASLMAKLVMPEVGGGWAAQGDEPITDWEPIYVNPTTLFSQRYGSGNDAVGLFVAYYGAQRQGSELINFQNVLVQEKDPWHVIAKDQVTLPVDDNDYQVKESRLRSAAGDLLIWQWYWVNGSHLGSKYAVKLREALDKLVTGRRRGAAIIVYTPVEQSVETARARLQAFASQAMTPLDRALTQIASETR